MALPEGAIAQRFRVDHGDVFPHGAFLVGEVTPVFDFDRSTKESRIQAVDADSGLLVWAVDVVDADPDAGRRQRTVTVKIAAKVQPVPPENKTPFPFRPVEFVGLSALAYVDDSGPRPRVAWSLKATGMAAPGVKVEKASA